MAQIQPPSIFAQLPYPTIRSSASTGRSWPGPSPSDDGPPKEWIIGVAVGCSVFAVGIIISIIACVVARRRRQQRRDRMNTTMASAMAAGARPMGQPSMYVPPTTYAPRTTVTAPPATATATAVAEPPPAYNPGAEPSTTHLGGYSSHLNDDPYSSTRDLLNHSAASTSTSVDASGNESQKLFVTNSGADTKT